VVVSRARAKGGGLIGSPAQNRAVGLGFRFTIGNGSRGR
jgi:hypothetical protein